MYQISKSCYFFEFCAAVFFYFSVGLIFLPSLYNILYPKKVNLYLEVIVFRIVPICVMISYYLNNIKLLHITAKTINNIGIIPTLPTTLVKKELKYDVIFSDLLSPKKIYPLA